MAKKVNSRELSMADLQAKCLKLHKDVVKASKKVLNLSKLNPGAADAFLAERDEVFKLTGETNISLVTVEGIISRLSYGENVNAKAVAGGAKKHLGWAMKKAGFTPPEWGEEGEEASDETEALAFAKRLHSKVKAKVELAKFGKEEAAASASVTALLDAKAKALLLGKDFEAVEGMEKREKLISEVLTDLVAGLSGRTRKKTNKVQAKVGTSTGRNIELEDALGDLLGD